MCIYISDYWCDEVLTGLRWVTDCELQNQAGWVRSTLNKLSHCFTPQTATKCSACVIVMTSYMHAYTVEQC